MDEVEDTSATAIVPITSTTSETNANINCYVHAVSPIKKASSSERKYFNCMLQTEKKCCRAVCFSPDKQSELKTFEKVKSPVRIQNYKTKPGLNGKDEIIIQKFTKFTALDNSDVNFTHNQLLTAGGLIPNISSLEKVASEQLISLKAHVLQISTVKQVQTQNQGSLKKQEVVLADPTSWIKLVLWQNNVDSLEEATSYILDNLRLKKFNNDQYLNTAKAEEFKYKETENFVDPLVQPDQPLYVESTIPACKVIGVLEATKQHCCVSCFKKVIILPNSALIQCTSCKLTQTLDSCSSQWYLRIMVKDTACPQKKFTLTLFHSQVEQLFATMHLQLDITSSTQEDVLVAILKSDQSICISFDPLSRKVTDMNAVSTDKE